MLNFISPTSTSSQVSFVKFSNKTTRWWRWWKTDTKMYHWLVSAWIQVNLSERESDTLSWRAVDFVETEDMVWIHSWVSRRQQDSRLNRVDGLSTSVRSWCTHVVYSYMLCTTTHVLYSVSHKNLPLYFWQYLFCLLIDFYNFCTVGNKTEHSLE